MLDSAAGLRRRPIVLGAAVATAALSLTSRAQTTAKKVKVGWLLPGGTTPEDQARYEQRTEKRFRELGWENGKNLQLVIRQFRGDPALLKSMAAELVAMNCDVIMAAENFALGTLLQAGAKVPLVVQIGSTLTEFKFVSSYAQPGGSVTGLAWDQSEAIISKYYELLKELVPKLRHVGSVTQDNVPGATLFDPVAERAAKQLGLAYTQFRANDVSEIEPVFAKLAAAGAQAVYVGGSHFSYVHMQRFIDVAGRYKMPDITIFRLAAESGALASYGADIEDLILRSTDYVDKILRGAKPGDLPVQLPTKYEFVINLKRARELGLTIPNSVLLRADKLVQ